MSVRRIGVGALVLAGVGLALTLRSGEQEDLIVIHVYKTPTCGCCVKWVSHLEAQGFRVTVEDLIDIGAVKTSAGVPADLSSCHTALVNGYAIEGHVPARVVRSFLEEAPGVAGIAVAGMPIGSPGMEGPNPQPYDVVAFREDGSRGVFARIEP